MNTQKVPVFCQAIQGIIMLDDNIVDTNGDIVHFYMQTKFLVVTIYWNIAWKLHIYYICIYSQ